MFTAAKGLVYDLTIFLNYLLTLQLTQIESEGAVHKKALRGPATVIELLQN